jgi:CubicO group peptidase (beta-lactamase class C family)
MSDRHRPPPTPGNRRRARLRRGFPLAVLALFALIRPSAAAAQHFPSGEDLSLMLRYLVEDGVTPGIVLGVLEADGTTRVVSHGSGGPGTRALGPLSEFEIGSLTKTFTAALLARMVDDGTVRLDDPVSKYLPDSVTVPARDGREITLRDLATHTSGLPRVPDDYAPPDPMDPYADYTVDMLYEFLSGYTLPRAPGAQYEYSNLGYGLLGHALARAAGTTFRALLRERVLDPLGMRMTVYAPEGDAAEWMTRGYDGDVVPHWSGTEAIDGAGGLVSNAADMLTWLKANVGLADDSLERAMRTAHEVRVPRGPPGAGIGFSWTTVVVPGKSPLVTHNGGTGGYRSMVALDPEHGRATVVLANTSNFDDALGTLLLFLDPPPAGWRSGTDPGSLRRFVGTYKATAGSAEYYVRLEKEGWLTYQPRGQVRARMYAKPDSSFYLLRGPWSFTFRTGERGGMTMAMSVDEREPGQTSMTREARRIEERTPPPAVAAGNER